MARNTEIPARLARRSRGRRDHTIYTLVDRYGGVITCRGDARRRVLLGRGYRDHTPTDDYDTETESFDVTGSTARQVLSWVRAADDEDTIRERAEHARDLEHGRGKPRRGLLEDLETIIADPDAALGE